MQISAAGMGEDDNAFGDDGSFADEGSFGDEGIAEE